MAKSGWRIKSTFKSPILCSYSPGWNWFPGASRPNGTPSWLLMSAWFGQALLGDTWEREAKGMTWKRRTRSQGLYPLRFKFNEVRRLVFAHFMLLLDKSQTRFVEDTGTSGLLLLPPMFWETQSRGVGSKECRRKPVLPPHQGIQLHSLELKLFAKCSYLLLPTHNAWPITHLGRQVVFFFLAGDF